MPYPDTTRSSKKNESAGGSTSLGPAAAPPGAAAQNATALVNSARNRAVGIANAARDWLHPPSFPDWFSSLSQIESLTTVMFSPLGGHPAYRSESLARALQLMQQQQQQRQRSAQTSSGSDVVLHSGRLALPPSSELLKAEIPESQAPLSLFQGFAAAYPSLTSPGSPSTSPKRSRHRRKKHGSTASIGSDGNRTLTQIIAEREQKMKEGDKLQMQKSSTANEINQINLQIEELINKRKALEARWAKLEAKEQQLRSTIDNLNDSIVSADDESRASDVVSSRTDNQETDSEEEIFERGKCYKTLEGHEDDVICVDFNHPKGILVSSSMDGTVRAWDLHRNRCVGDLATHPSLVRCVKVNDAHLLTGSDNGTIKQWDLSMIPPLPSSPSTVSSISSQSDSSSSPTPGESLPSLCNCCVGTLEGHRGEVTALHFENSTAVSGANDKTMKQWDLETQQCVLTLDVMWATNSTASSSKLHTQVPLGQWSLDGLYDYLEMSENYIGALQFWNFALASGTIDGKIRMWDLRTGQVHRTLPAHNGAITCLQFDEIHLVSGGVDKNIKIWDLRTGSVFDTLSFSDPVTSLQFDASRIVSSTTRETIDIYNRTSFQHTTLSGHGDQVNSVRFRESVLASGGNDHVVKLWAL